MNSDFREGEQIFLTDNKPAAASRPIVRGCKLPDRQPARLRSWCSYIPSRAGHLLAGWLFLLAPCDHVIRAQPRIEVQHAANKPVGRTAQGELLVVFSGGIQQLSAQTRPIFRGSHADMPLENAVEPWD